MDLLASGKTNRQREVDNLVETTSVGSLAVSEMIDEISPMENSTSTTSSNTNTGVRTADEVCEGTHQPETRRPRIILEPIDSTNLNRKKFRRFTEITLKDLGSDGARANNRGFLDLQLLRVIANGRSKTQNQVKYYKAKDSSKKIQTVAYKRLFMFRLISLNANNVTNNLVYVLEDDIHHANMWNLHTSIRDNGNISIGTIVRFFCPKPYENVMPDGIPSIESRFPVAVMKTPSNLPDVFINYTISGGETKAFCLNGCHIDILQITPEETGCSGKFCDKQRVIEVRRYNEGCGCYSYDSRRTSFVIDHTMNIGHHSLETDIHVTNYSSLKFSLLYQTGVFNSEVRVSSLEGMSDDFFDLEDAVNDIVGHINENGGFTVTGWYKKGIVKDRTILHQVNNDDTKKKL